MTKPKGSVGVRKPPAKSKLKIVADNPHIEHISRPQGGGSQLFNPTASDQMLVQIGCFLGLTKAQIAAQIPIPGKMVPGMSIKSLDKYFAKELAVGSTNIELQIANSLLQKALGSGPASVTAAIFLAKARLRWDDQPHLDKPEAPDEDEADGPPVVTLRMATA